MRYSYDDGAEGERREQHQPEHGEALVRESDLVLVEGRRVPAARAELGAVVIRGRRGRRELAVRVGPVELERHGRMVVRSVRRIRPSARCVAGFRSLQRPISWTSCISDENKAPTDSASWMRRMASPMSGATESWRSWAGASAAGWCP